MLQEKYQNYTDQLQKLADIEYAAAVLEWDKEVNLPKKGGQIRARQTATLYGMAHEIFTSSKFKDLLEELNQGADRLDEKQKRNVEESHRTWLRKNKFNKEFVIKRSKLVSEGYHAWKAAKEENNASKFLEALKPLVELKREEAEILGYQEHPYDALLEEFEPGYTTAQLDTLFKDVKTQLIDFVQQIRQKPKVNNDFLKQHFPHQKQWDFGIEILRQIGYDFDAGRQDISDHPFTINFSPSDVRVTTRIDENNFGSMTWSCIHEGGHALYEQGLPSEQYGLPLGQFVSLGIHESQSRLWENNVGRSLPFWEAHYDLAKTYFPEQLKEVDAQAFYKGINKIQPSLIRVESDELHYHFHILIRFELEKALIEGSLEVEDLEIAWNEKYKQYLDLDINNPTDGVMQDIHWALGSFGYFPTYSLGSFYAAQFFEQAKKDIPHLITQIKNGDTSSLLEWLRNNIHQHGKMYSADELCRRITGESLNFKYFMDYAKKKYSSIYFEQGL
ncbi:MAG: carboxypeptidase M32 [Saprospiraceae bacterium]|nr:carboxypeptidase M32 [Saprospiraceae bacterium]